MKKFLITFALMFVTTLGFAQRFTDKIDRGLVAVPSNGGNLVSWRVFGEEYYDVTYNLYCNDALLASNLEASNYFHGAGNASSKYYVIPVVKGVEQTAQKSSSVTRWNDGYKLVNLIEPVDRYGNKAGDYYAVNDISVGDLTGNGVVEFIIKRPCSDMKDTSQSVRFHHLDCYDINGNRLWWIDLGPNMSSGPDEQWDAVCYDWDCDGKAEVLLRLEDNSIIHLADGSTIEIGDMNVDTRNTLYSGELCYTKAGNEYLLYLEGATGKPYQIGPSEHPNYMEYPLPRLETSEFNKTVDWAKIKNYSNESAASAGVANFADYLSALNSAWGDTSGHRSTKHYWGAPFLDGRHASIFLGRGCYTRHKFVAFDVDPSTHQLTQLWRLNQYNSSSPWYGNGYHNFAIGDVDWDGRDEIIFGSMVIDDNGKGLSTTDYGHGDAQHCSDFDPYRAGEEQFACLEEGRGKYGCNYRNATTAQIYVKKDASGDDGRALMGNFTNAYPGSVGRSVSSDWISSVADKTLTELNGNSFIDWSDLNARIYWDGDLLDEYMDSPGTAKAAVVYKPGTGSRLVQCVGSLANDSKNNAGVLGDILGDWREELVLRYGNNAFVIYTTTYPTEYRIPTLWHDHQYRNAMVWQSMGYNQPPHKSYFLGELEGITVAPPPYTMTGRTEVANGGTITTTDEHLIVCETNNTTVSIADGASPYIVTFNVPSWVQGTAGDNCMTKNTAIDTTYYECVVTGGALTGSTRLIKQGDGILTLPAVDMTYTGETNIWAGTVNFNGSAKNTPVWVNRFGILNSKASAAEFKSLKSDYGSVVSPGGDNSLGTITATDTYTMGFGSRLKLDLYSDGLKADMIKTAKLVVEKKNWTYGPKYLMPVIEVTEHKAEGAETLEPGRYLIANATEVEGTLGNIKVEGVTNLKIAFEQEDNGDIYLVLGSVRGKSSIVWTGASSSIWDYATTENFYVETDDSKTPDVFVEGDLVHFTDEASSFTVTLADGTELPSDTIYVNNTKDYTISGNGIIVSGALVKEGTGTLTMGGNNTYTGGNYLKGGTTKVSSLANSTQAYGNLGAVTTASAKFTMENGAVLQSTAEVKLGSPVKMIGDEGGVISNSALFTMEKGITGTALTKKGSGKFDMQGSLSASKLTVSAGEFAYSYGSYAKQTYLEGTGALSGKGFLTTPIYVASGAKGGLITVNRATSSNKLTGDGQITIYCATEKGNNYYATRTPIQLNLTGFEGTVVPQAVYTADGRFTLDTSSGSAKCTFDIPSGIIVQNSGKTFRIGKVTGSGNLGGTCTFSSAGNSNVNTWQVGNDENFTYSGVVEGNAKFTKLGTGKMTVGGTWTTTGAVNINAGEVHINSGSALGTGTLTVAKDATLSGVNGLTANAASKAPLTNSNFTINGTLQVGMTETMTSGFMNFNGKNVTMGDNSVLILGIRRAVTDDTSLSGACIQNINKLTINGTIRLFSSSYTPQEGDIIRLWTDVATVEGNPTVEFNDGGVTFDTSRLSEGIVIVSSIDTSIDDIAADEIVTVDVISANGVVVEQFTCPMGAVNSTFRKLNINKGIYLLNIKGETANGTKKVMK